MQESLELIHEIPKGLLKWYDFEPESKALYIGDAWEGWAEALNKAGLHVSSMTPAEVMRMSVNSDNVIGFRYIVAVASVEQSEAPVDLLRKLKRLLMPDGIMLLGMNNRLGLRYFCGDGDIYTNRNFDGIEHYQHVQNQTGTDFHGRMYSCAEIKNLLRDAGWNTFKFYSVLTDLENPSLIYAEDTLPNEDLSNRVYPTYHCADTVFLAEEYLYSTLAENGMFHAMANAYLVECTENGKLSDVSHVTCSIERGQKNALFTRIRGKSTVEKEAIYFEGKERLKALSENLQKLTRNGMKTVRCSWQGDKLVMPYIDAEVGQLYLKRLLLTDKKKFLSEMDRFRALILKSSPIVAGAEDDADGLVLKEGFPDLVPLNSFHINDDFVFYDQEFCEENYPANAIVLRMIDSFYGNGNPELHKALPSTFLLERYGLMENLEKWRGMQAKFLGNLRKEKELAEYHAKVRRNDELVNANRWRLNYSETEYKKRFVDTFEYIGNRNLILFGSGKIANRFMETYAMDYPVYAVVDNDEKKWGTGLHGVAIQSPKLLTQLQPGTYHVVVCIRECMPIMRQLEGMGVMAYCVFEPSRHYRRKRCPILMGAEQKQKKYHVGYVAGVFDLFHIGHLNLLRRAKEQCDYLIVGVVTDRQARESKKLPPFIPFEERVKLVEACRYVDEVREIPYENPDTDMAWQIYHFDVQFSGSDYEHDPVWLAKKKYLEERGATMVFFPYTESTSSTKIKELINERLL